MPRGFTLVEAMVAVAVFAILAALALPAFTGSLEKARLRGAADAVVALVADARMRAVVSGRDVAVRVVGAQSLWCVGAREAPVPAPGLPAGSGVACDCLGDDAACVVRARRAVVAGAAFKDVALLAPVDAMVFAGGSGVRDASGGALRLLSRSGRHAVTVAISPLGHASLCSDGAVSMGMRPC